MSEETINWFVSVDWGSEKHQVCVLDSQGGLRGEREFPHSGAGLTALADWVQSIAGQASMVAIDAPHGRVVDVLLDRDFIAYSINPKQLDCFRERFSVAGAKDDGRDARAAADGASGISKSSTMDCAFEKMIVAPPKSPSPCMS